MAALLLLGDQNVFEGRECDAILDMSRPVSIMRIPPLPHIG